MDKNNMVVHDNLPMIVKGIEYLKEDNDVNVHLAIFSAVKMRMVDVIIKRSTINAKSLKAHIASAGGITPADKDMPELVERLEEYINKLVVQGMISTAHKHIGFIRDDDVVEFRAYNTIIDSEANEGFSRYYGRFNINPRGSFKKIKKLFQYLDKNCSMALPLSMLGATATVLSYSNHQWNTHIYNFIVHLLGSSSTGKTTVAKLVASFGGSTVGSNGFLLSYLATPNAIISRLNGTYGYPFALDEFSTAKRNKNWSEFVYTVSNGYDKDRCIAGGQGIAETGSFEIVVVSTGEISVSSKCNKNNGLAVRLFEITTDCLYRGTEMNGFTSSAEESDYIKTVADNNYGILTPMIVEELMRNSTQYNELRLQWRRIIEDRYKSDNLISDIGQRVMDYVAIIMTATEVMKNILEIDFDLMDIFEFYYFHFLYKNSEDSNMPEKVYSLVRKMILTNENKLYDSMELNGMPYLDEEHIGYKVDLSHYKNQDRHKGADGNYYDILYVFPVDYVEDYLAVRGYEDPKQAINTLRKQKLIKCARSGNNPKFVLKTETVSMDTYAFWVKKNDDLYNYGVNTQDIIEAQL